MDKLPKGWKISTIGDVCIKITDGTHKTPTYTEDGIPFLSVKDITKGYIDFSNTRFISKIEHKELIKRCNPEINDLLYTKVGTTGVAKVIDTEREFSLFVSLALLKPNKFLIESHFFEHLLNSPAIYSKAQEKTRGVANRNLVLTDIKSIQIPLPLLPEQARIVIILDALITNIDKCIGLIEENIKHTLALMASVLDGMFDSTKEQIEISKLIVKNENINPLNQPETEFTYIDITSINNEKHQISEPKTLLGKETPSRARKLVRLGDIVFATTRPNLRNIAIVDKEYNNPVASTGFCVLRTKKELNNEFLFLCLISNNIQEQIAPFIHGAQYPAISDKDLLQCKIPNLKLEDQIRVANKIMQVREKLSLLSREQRSKLTYLKALKASLLDRAFKGEL